MNLTGIISISGRPGLFKVIAQGKNSVIVESMIDKKRFPAYATEKISTLEDISIFTYEEDVKLTDVLSKMNETFTITDRSLVLLRVLLSMMQKNRWKLKPFSSSWVK